MAKEGYEEGSGKKVAFGWIPEVIPAFNYPSVEESSREEEQEQKESDDEVESAVEPEYSLENELTESTASEFQLASESLKDRRNMEIIKDIIKAQGI